MTRTKLLLLSGLGIALSGAAIAELNEERVNELIGEYLNDNPEAIIESLQAYQMQEEVRREEARLEAIKEVLPAFEGKDLHYGEAGNPQGDVTIVEFFDYNCPACKMMFDSIDKLLLEDKNVQVIFVEMPIFGATSDENARISLAVNALHPTKYFRFHQAAMNLKGKKDADQMLAIAADLGIDKDKLKQEAAKEEYAIMLAADRELADKIEVTGTPALLINDRFVGGALSPDQLKAEVAAAREAAEQTDN